MVEPAERGRKAAIITVADQHTPLCALAALRLSARGRPPKVKKFIIHHSLEFFIGGGRREIIQ